jgi:hypothetical protein
MPRSSLITTTLTAALLLATSARADEAMWRRYTRQGTKAYRAKNFEVAEKAFLRAAKVGHGLGDSRRRYVESLGHLATVYRAQGETGEVRKAYRMAISALEKARADHTALPGFLVKAAAAALLEDDRTAAASHLERSAGLLEARGEDGERKATELRVRAAGLRLEAAEVGSNPATLRSAQLDLAEILGTSEDPQPERRRDLYALVLAAGLTDGADKAAREQAARAAAGLEALAAASGDRADAAAASLARGRLALASDDAAAAKEACGAVLTNPASAAPTMREGHLCAAEAAVVTESWSTALDHVRALRDWRAALAPSDPSRLRPLRIEARALLELGRDALAEPALRALLPVQVDFLGPRHPHVAQTLEDLARVRITQGDHAEAASLLEKASAIRGKDGDLASRAETEILLARLQLARKETKEARATLAAIRQELEAADQVTDTRYLEVLGLQAALAREAGDAATSVKAIEFALAARRKAEAYPKAATVGLLHDLGVLAMGRGDKDAAMRHLEEAQRVAAEAKMKAHPMAARVAGNLGVLRKAAGDRGAARKAYQGALRTLGDAGMSSSVAAATITFNLAVLDEEEGRFSEARTGLRTAWEAYAASKGGDSPEALQALEALAALAMRTRDHATARNLYPKLIVSLERIHGKEAGELAAPLLNYASTLMRASKKRRKARALFARAERIGKAKLGRKHEVTRKAAKMVAMFDKVNKKR